MADPNEPRVMTPPRGNGKRKPMWEPATGDAGHTGFTRVSGRDHPGDPNDMFARPGTDTTINPPVGQRDYGRGPRFSED